MMQLRKNRIVMYEQANIMYAVHSLLLYMTWTFCSQFELEVNFSFACETSVYLNDKFNSKTEPQI